MGHRHAGTFTPPITDAEYHWLKNLIRNYYVFADRQLGEILRETDKNTSVVVCSDHGFGGGGKGSWPTSWTGSSS